MKKKFTFLIAALALLSFLAIPMGMRGQSTNYSSNVTFSNLSSNSSTCTVVINNDEFNGVKMGTSSNKSGNFTVSVPSGTTKLHVHAAGWANKAPKLSVSTEATGVTISPSTTWSLTADGGITGGGSTFTLSSPNNASSSYYKEYTLSGVTENTTITITNTTERAVVWGVNYVAGDNTVATPTFNPNGGHFVNNSNQSVAISCTTEGATIYYSTTSKTGPWTVGSSVSILGTNETKTIWAYAEKESTESSVDSAEFVFAEPISIAAARTQGTGTVFTTGTVTSCVGTSSYIQDASAAINVFGASLTVGDNISVHGTLSDYHGLLEITSPQVNVISSGITINPEVMTIAEVNASTKQGWYVRIENATVTAKSGQNTTIAQGDNTIVVRGISSSVDYDVNDIISLNGNIGYYDPDKQIANPTNVTVQQATTHSLNFGVSPASSGTVTVVGFESSPANVAEGATVNISATANTGYNFNSWTVNGAGSSVADATSATTTFTMGTADATLTANFAQVQTYNVTYYANNGEATSNIVTLNAGSTVTAAANTFTYAGHSFTGWNTQSTGNGTSYASGDEITNNLSADIDLYAQWIISNETNDCLDREFTGVAAPAGSGSSSYTAWTNKQGSSGAVYAGQSAGGDNNSGECIQLRSNNNNSGIVTTSSGGKALKVTVTWNTATADARVLQVYGKNTAYTDATDLYDSNKQGTLLGEIAKSADTELTITGDYEYIGLRSKSGAMYLDEICITWSTGTTPTPQSYDLTVELNSNVEAIFVYDANDQSNPLITEGNAGTVQVASGTSIMVSPDVASGYVLASLTVDGDDVTSQITGGKYTFTMPTHNVTVTATATGNIPSTPSNRKYVRITSLDQLTDGCRVIIAARYDETNTADYYAMSGSTSGKPSGVDFTSEISNNIEILPDAITSSEDTYYWTVNVTNDGYTFTNANNQLIGYSSGTSFATGGNNTAWTISRETSETTAMVADYTGFVIRNVNTNTRAFAYNGSAAFGPYSTTNMSAAGYNFFLDFFVEAYTLTVNGYGDDNTVKNGWYLIASPVNTTPTEVTNMIPDDPNTHGYDLYRFNQSNAENKQWENYRNYTSYFNITPGQGYLYANSQTVTLGFSGTVYTGNGVFDLDYHDGATLKGYNLVGNPFSTQASVDKDYYIMNDAHNEVVAAESGRKVNPMEGIFVLATPTEQKVTFTQASSSTGSNNNSTSSVVMNLTQNRGSVVDRAIVRFGGNNNLPKLQLFENNTKLYIAQDGKDYAIVSAEAQGEMPVNFKAAVDGTYTINVATEGIEANYLHLIDNLTGMDVDLLQTPSYTFNARKNDYASRFRLVFSANNAENGNDSFAFISNGQIILTNVDNDATVQVIDALGRMIVSTNANNHVYTDNMAPGVYVLRLVNGNDVKTQKIVVK